MILPRNFLIILGGGDLPPAIHDQLKYPSGAGVCRWLLTTAPQLHHHASHEGIKALLKRHKYRQQHQRDGDVSSGTPTCPLKLLTYY